MVINKNSYYYLNTQKKEIMEELFSEQWLKSIKNCETIITDSLKEYLEGDIQRWCIPNNYITGWLFDYDTKYKTFKQKLWGWICITDYYFTDLKLLSIDFNDNFYKDFNIENNYENNEKLEELFKELFKNIALPFEERECNAYYNQLNLKYLGYKNQQLNDFYYALTININRILNFRGYGVLDDIHTSFVQMDMDEFVEICWTPTDIIDFLGE